MNEQQDQNSDVAKVKKRKKHYLAEVVARKKDTSSGGPIRGMIYFVLLTGLALGVMYQLSRLNYGGHVSNESSAIGALRTIVTSNQQFRILKKAPRKDGTGRFGTFTELVDHEMIDETYKKNYKSGYNFTLTLSPEKSLFVVHASPAGESDGERMFFVDQTGKITFSTKRLPDRNSEGVD